MCNKITKISQQNKYQWIGICNHGTAHVCWRTSKICLPAYELEALMNKALAGKLPVETVGDEYVLWLNRTAIKLTKQDYLDIQELFSYGAEATAMPLLQKKSVTDEGRLVLH